MRNALIAGAAIVVAACSGSMSAAQPHETAAQSATVQRSYAVSGFERVGSVGPHRIVVSVGPAFSVQAEGPAETLARTEVVVENGELLIRPLRDKRWKDEWRDYKPATFTVSLPRLDGASMVGSGEMTVDRVVGDAFSGSVAGSGTLDVSGVAVRDANLSVAGSGDLVVKGKAVSSQASVAGSGNLRARDLASDSASISIAGSGDAALTVHDEAQVSIVGSGDVDVTGSAHCTVSRVGSGKARCGGNRGET